MQTVSYQSIKELSPCYDPVEIGMPDTYQASLVDFIEEYKDKVKKKEDILWVARNYIDDKTLRLFAVWCAREALKLIGNPDPRSVNACAIAEKFANGEATQEELAAAWDAARDTAWYAARDAAWDAAWAARAAARDAARDAAWDAAWYAARDAAWDAAWYAARDAARDAAWDAQIAQLLKMVKEKVENLV